jgi:hypothetical protein
MEGRSRNLALIDVYSDPFILYGYLSSIAFFVALYKTIRLLNYIRQDIVFSTIAVGTVKSIKYCAFILSILIVIAGIYIGMFHATDDDPAGFLALCFGATIISIFFANAAAVLEKILQKGLEIQIENEKIFKQSKK